MTRYLEWDYERNTVTEYRREGECNQCGECCPCCVSTGPPACMTC